MGCITTFYQNHLRAGVEAELSGPAAHLPTTSVVGGLDEAGPNLANKLTASEGGYTMSGYFTSRMYTRVENRRSYNPTNGVGGTRSK